MIARVLAEQEEKIAATIIPYVEILAQPSGAVPLWKSKFGGLPYLPKSFSYPKSSNGTHLHLLAQINFAEVPHLEPFPRQGILQFYIGGDELYGLGRGLN